MMAGLNCGTPSLIVWPIVSRGLDWCVSIDDERAAEAMRALAQVGIVVGETGAASLGGLAALADGLTEPDARAARGLRDDATVLLLCTEGATDPANYERLVGCTPDAVVRTHPIPNAT